MVEISGFLVKSPLKKVNNLKGPLSIIGRVQPCVFSIIQDVRLVFFLSFGELLIIVRQGLPHPRPDPHRALNYFGKWVGKTLV